MDAIYFKAITLYLKSSSFFIDEYELFLFLSKFTCVAYKNVSFELSAGRPKIIFAHTQGLYICNHPIKIAFHAFNWCIFIFIYSSWSSLYKMQTTTAHVYAYPTFYTHCLGIKRKRKKEDYIFFFYRV